MSKNIKKQENLFISTQQDATQAQMMVPSDQSLNFQVEETFKCPLYFADKPEWVDDLNKASDPIIARLKKNWKKKIKDPKDPTTGLPNSYHSELLWQYPEFQTIANLILQQSWNILHWQGYQLKDRIPMLTELWVQEFPEEGGFHDIHVHGNNHIFLQPLLNRIFLWNSSRNCNKNKINGTLTNGYPKNNENKLIINMYKYRNL